MKFLDKIEDYIYDNWEKNKLCKVAINIICFYDYLQYLFDKADNPGWCNNNKIIDFFCRLKCRIKRHPCGIIYYNTGSYEPDGRCKDCGDLIG